MCNFSYDFTSSPGSVVSGLKNFSDSHQGTFRGNENSGSFAFHISPFKHVFAANYQISGQTISLDVTQKPWDVSCQEIKSNIKKYLN